MEQRSMVGHAFGVEVMNMDADAILGLMTPVTYFVLLAIEAIWPAREFPAIRRWRLVGFAFVVMLMTLGIVTPMLLPAEWLASHRLLHGERLGVAGGVVVGLLTMELIAYGFHRAAHRASFLWRFMHQVHHAPQRIDIASSAVFHPTEIIVQNVLGIAVATFVLGLHPLAAGILGYIGAFMGIFQHMNVRTPRWLGYVIQRPESHCVHHQLNVHAFNYGNLAIWDIVFGTFKNPETFEGRVGFAERASFWKMFVGKDVSGGLGDGLDKRRMAQTDKQQVAA